jgi:membrane-bound PQQ-dependent dehydrogenase (glucose/quinate/shikimate family)
VTREDHSLTRAGLLLSAAALALSASAGPAPAPAPPDPGEWRSYGRDIGGTRYSPLDQIQRGNVARLARAWTFHTGEHPIADRLQEGQARPAAFETTPLAVRGRLYLSTPGNRVIALDGDTGHEVWRYDPFGGAAKRHFQAHRGVAFWESGNDHRILFGTSDGRLVALDAERGLPVPGFGRDGALDLRAGVADSWPKAEYAVTSPPAIFRDLVIVGAAVPEKPGHGPSGAVRAFDVRTGRQVWRFDTIPRPGEPGHESWKGDSWRDRTGANVWSVMSVDDERGLVFLPVGSAAYDFYGGDRVGDDLYASSLVALDAATGRKVWHFQMVHHDIWDYDPPAQPVLVTLRRDGKPVPAVVQVTKMGLVFVLDRRDGRPLFPIEERPVPGSDVPGEETSPTQPFPVRPLPLSRQSVTEAELSRVTPEHAKFCRELFATLRTGPAYTPYGKEMTLVLPGTLGGATWSSASFDPASGLLFVNANETGAIGRMEEQPAGSPVPFRRNGPGGDEYARFWDARQRPCVAPPWGTLTAILLSSGERSWRVPLGVDEELAAHGVPPTGTPNIGGSIVTAGGLVFIAASNDRRFRAFDAATGRELWSAELEASGHATPMTYRGAHGRQYVVVAAGGGGYFSPTWSDVVAAFALPE